jgi:hypothetical protein
MGLRLDPAPSFNLRPDSIISASAAAVNSTAPAGPVGVLHAQVVHGRPRAVVVLHNWDAKELLHESPHPC